MSLPDPGNLFDMTDRVAIVTGGSRGIRVNAIAPGPFRTDMLGAGGAELEAEMTGKTLLGRIAEPDEIMGALPERMGPNLRATLHTL